MNAETVHHIIEDLKAQHAESEEWCRAEVRACKSNLLKFYRSRLQNDVRQALAPAHPWANMFTALIFSLPWSAHVLKIISARRGNIIVCICSCLFVPYPLPCLFTADT